MVMANLAATLKQEIRRLARREIKAQTGKTRQAVAQYRREIASLKRQIQEQDRKLQRLESQGQKRAAAPGIAEEPASNLRFSAKSVRAQRKRLGFSAADYAMLLGVSPLTVYNWEHGKTRPRSSQMAALLAVRGIGKRAALARLQSRPDQSGPSRGKRGGRKAK
jgi:DNA-binding transcriptional regulator YiaG